ncbi:Sulfhydryl oxidase [Balamuthia mandrillaris]
MLRRGTAHAASGLRCSFALPTRRRQFSAAATAKKEVYAWGMGLEQPGVMDATPRCFDLPSPRLTTSTSSSSSSACKRASYLFGRSNKSVQLSQGDFMVVVYENEDGTEQEVVSWGNNDRGQLGLGDRQKRFWGEASSWRWPVKERGRLRTIALGRNHALFASDDRVYSCGRGMRGQTGLSITEDTLQPTEVEALRGKRIKGMAAGDDFSIVATEEGVFGFGNRKKLDVSSSTSPEDVFRPKLMEKLSAIMEEAGDLQHIACGWGHSLMLVGSKVYAWGSNLHGQCGIGTKEESVILPRLVEALADQPVAMVSCGGSYSLALTRDSREVYVWGSVKDDKSGLGDVKEDILRPRRIPLFDKEKQACEVSCGTDHAAVRTEDGNVYTWGFGQHGTLGFPEARNEMEPRLLQLPNGKRCIGISCGMDITLAFV